MTHRSAAIVTFVMVWWLVFFMALPFGAAPEEHPQPGNVESAPAQAAPAAQGAGHDRAGAAATWGIAWLMDSGLIDRPAALRLSVPRHAMSRAVPIRAMVEFDTPVALKLRLTDDI